jgi:chemotaxis signal transduction protein
MPGVRGSFVLVHIGDRRFAVAAGAVAELSPPVRLHTFPHTSACLSGVIVRRGRIVPVCNAGALLGGRGPSANLFYLIAECNGGEGAELLAIPVNGESELASGEMVAREDSAPDHISGTVRTGSGSVAILNLSALAVALRQALPSTTPEVPS